MRIFAIKSRFQHFCTFLPVLVSIGQARLWKLLQAGQWCGVPGHISGQGQIVGPLAGSMALFWRGFGAQRCFLLVAFLCMIEEACQSLQLRCLAALADYQVLRGNFWRTVMKISRHTVCTSRKKKGGAISSDSLPR